MMPDVVVGIDGKNIHSSDIFMEQEVIEELRKF